MAGEQMFDAVVVGAGPAGASAAYHLATRGRRVLLLDRRTFPRDKCCGDGLTPGAVRLLSSMGVLAELNGVQRVDGVRVHMRNRGTRDFPYERIGEPGFGMVVPRLQLDARLCDKAVAAGATMWTGARATRLLLPATGNSTTAVHGIEVERAGHRTKLQVPAVVAADGAASRLAQQTGLRPVADDWTGFAARAYFSGIQDLPDLLEIYLPLVDVTERHLLPSYGWVFPIGPGAANVGVGLFNPTHGENIRALYDRFVAGLAERDPRFRHAHQTSSMTGAPLRLDFEPSRCGLPGLLLTGDAAGLISPFTGEGISFALESGALAADEIDAALAESDGDPIHHASYVRRLGARYAGYFETGRYSVRRYLLAWRVLESTFHDDRPLFTLVRRVALFQDGACAQPLLDPLPRAAPALVAKLRRDLLAVAELLSGCVRDDWPMFARMANVEEGLSKLSVRPAVLLLAAAYVGGRPHPLIQPLAAAVDLSFLAALAVDSSVDSPSVPWGNRFAVLVADFLLARAYELAARGGGAVVTEFADALAAACEGRVRELRAAHGGCLDGAEWVDLLASKTATAFELPCRLGAWLGGAGRSAVEAVTAYGRHLGVSYALAEEARKGVGNSRQGHAAPGGAPMAALVKDAGPTQLAELAVDHARKASAVLHRVPPGPARDLLALLTDRSAEGSGGQNPASTGAPRPA